MFRAAFIQVAFFLQVLRPVSNLQNTVLF